jgi:hypothetical protein
MNQNAKKAAVKRLGEAVLAASSKEEACAIIEADEKGFPSEEVNEIYYTIIGESKQSEVKGNAKPKPIHYEEWQCEINNGQADKLKIIRPCVKITDLEAESLNHGQIHGGNKYAKLYFKPE